MTQEATVEQQQTLVAALRRVLGGAAGAAAGAGAALFETHISWVLVAGQHAYKVKKALRFDFLDFSTLAARRHFCHEELRLNRRLAPDLYEEVVAFTGSAGHPGIEPDVGADVGADDEPIEYALRMRAFAQEALWSYRIEQRLLCGWEIDQLAHKLAHFHLGAARAPSGSCWGTPQALRRVAADTHALIADLAGAAPVAADAQALRAWEEERQQGLAPVFAARKAHGWVRECHGDLHSGNILSAGGKVEVFDCIEFNESLRWIDVMHDLAFIHMDLQLHGCRALAARLLNGYLAGTGDYEGVPLLRYYQTECALVRAKVALVRARQAGHGPGAASAHEQRAGALLAAARAFSRPGQPAIIAMHGFAGSGKSTLAQRLVELFGAVQLRSDVERKRMHGLAPCARAPAPAGGGLYDDQATRAVYARLRVLASIVAGAGLPVLVDASCLARWQRSLFETLASELGLPFLIVDVRAREATLKERIARRRQAGNDPSDADQAVLEHQLRVHEPLTGAEAARVLAVDSEAPFDAGGLTARARALWAGAPD